MVGGALFLAQSEHNRVEKFATQFGTQRDLLELVGLILIIDGAQLGCGRISRQLGNLPCNRTQMLGRIARVMLQRWCPVLVIESRINSGIAIEQVQR